MFYGLLLVSDGTNVTRTKSNFHAGQRVSGYTITDSGAAHTYYTSPTNQVVAGGEAHIGTVGIEDDIVDSTTSVALSTLTNFQNRSLFINVTREDGTAYTEQLNGQIAGASTAATGTAVLSGSSVASVTIVGGGTGYVSTPRVAFTGGGGSGATGTAVVSGGVVTGVTITNAGQNYSSAPTAAFIGGGSAGVYLVESTFNDTADADPDAPSGDEEDRRILAKFREDKALLQQGQLVDVEITG